MKKTKKKKMPKGKRVNRIVSFKLTDEQKAKKGYAASELSEELAVLRVEKKTTTDMFSAKIKSAESKMVTLLKEIHTGSEERDTDCVEVLNFDRNTVEYWADGEVVEERKMTQEDCQLELKPVSKKKFQQIKDGTTGETGKVDPIAEVVNGQKNKDIADVYRMETGKNTSKSVLNQSRM